MGAALGCYSGPEADWDALLTTRALHRASTIGGVHGKPKRHQQQPPMDDAGVLGKLQRTLSRSLLLRGREPSGGGDSGAKSDSHDDGDGGELARSWSQSYSSASGTSGSRLLSDFYNLVLESERNTCFKDKHGKRVAGAYLDEVPIIEDYFGPGSRKRQRQPPPTTTAHQLPPIMDRFAHLPTALMSTTSTISSDVDYWSSLDSMTLDHDELLQDKAPRRYDSASAAMNGLLLFSPLHSSDVDGAAHRLSKSLSPHPRWAGFGGVQFYEVDEDGDGDEDLSSRSAYAYTPAQLRRHSPLPKQLLKASASTASRTPLIYARAKNADAVAPMMAS